MPTTLILVVGNFPADTAIAVHAQQHGATNNPGFASFERTRCSGLFLRMSNSPWTAPLPKPERVNGKFTLQGAIIPSQCSIMPMRLSRITSAECLTGLCLLHDSSESKLRVTRLVGLLHCLSRGWTMKSKYGERALRFWLLLYFDTYLPIRFAHGICVYSCYFLSLVSHLLPNTY